MEDLMQFLREEGISEDVLHEVHEYVVSHPVSDAMKQRIPALQNWMRCQEIDFQIT